MYPFLPSTLLTLLFALPALSHASPQPALLSSTDHYAISLVPRHTLFYRQTTDLQTFASALGGTRASAITNSGDTERPFSVDGSTFDSFQSAAERSCDNQFQACANAANGNGRNRKGKRGDEGGKSGKNGGKGGKRRDTGKREVGVKRQDGGLTVQQCDEQKEQCKSAQSAAAVQDFAAAAPVASTNIGPDPQFPDFDLICEG